MVYQAKLLHYRKIGTRAYAQIIDEEGDPLFRMRKQAGYHMEQRDYDVSQFKDFNDFVSYMEKPYEIKCLNI